MKAVVRRIGATDEWRYDPKRRIKIQQGARRALQFWSSQGEAANRNGVRVYLRGPMKGRWCKIGPQEAAKFTHQQLDDTSSMNGIPVFTSDAAGREAILPVHQACWYKEELEMVVRQPTERELEELAIGSLEFDAIRMGPGVVAPDAMFTAIARGRHLGRTDNEEARSAVQKGYSRNEETDKRAREYHVAMWKEGKDPACIRIPGAINFRADRGSRAQEAPYTSDYQFCQSRLAALEKKHRLQHDVDAFANPSGDNALHSEWCSEHDSFFDDQALRRLGLLYRKRVSWFVVYLREKIAQAVERIMELKAAHPMWSFTLVVPSWAGAWRTRMQRGKALQISGYDVRMARPFRTRGPREISSSARGTRNRGQRRLYDPTEDGGRNVKAACSPDPSGQEVHRDHEGKATEKDHGASNKLPHSSNDATLLVIRRARLHGKSAVQRSGRSTGAQKRPE